MPHVTLQHVQTHLKMGSALAQYVDVIQGLVTNGFSHEISNIMQGIFTLNNSR